MKKFIRIMKALSDPNRSRIIKLLQKDARCVCEIKETLGLAQPTVSKHLRQLEEAGLVTSRKTAQWVYYRLSNGSDSPYAAVMLGNLKYWLEDHPSPQAEDLPIDARYRKRSLEQEGVRTGLAVERTWHPGASVLTGVYPEGKP